LIGAGVDYVVLSSDVDGRVLAAPATYPRQVAFYKALVRRGRVVASFAPRRDERGPVITVYRLPPPGVETAAAQHARA
jgi:hypothetical protein